MVYLNMLERLFVIDVTIGGEYMNIVMILEAINEIYD